MALTKEEMKLAAEKCVTGYCDDCPLWMEDCGPSFGKAYLDLCAEMVELRKANRELTDRLSHAMANSLAKSGKNAINNMINKCFEGKE